MKKKDLTELRKKTKEELLKLVAEKVKKNVLEKSKNLRYDIAQLKTMVRELEIIESSKVEQIREE